MTMELVTRNGEVRTVVAHCPECDSALTASDRRCPECDYEL